MKKTLLCFCLSILLSQISIAQCAGLQIIGINSDNPDQVLLQATAFIPGNTTFYLTDDEWNGDYFQLGETIVSWTTPASGCTAGSTILLQDVIGPNCGTSSLDVAPALSTNGDEIYITSIHPSEVISTDDICFAILFGGTGDITGIASVNLGNIDNGIYNGGDISVAANWTTSNNHLTLPNPLCVGPLPIELIDFSVSNKEESAYLTWSTATEQDNEYFSVEHSLNGRYFSEIAIVNGAGTVVNTQYYNFAHEAPAKGDNYYRLKQVDFDGDFSYSPIEVIRFDNNSISIYPTLAQDHITVALGEANNNNAIIRIYDLMGRLIISEQLGSDVEQKEINVSTLGNGHYILQLQLGDEIHSQRFVKF